MESLHSRAKSLLNQLNLLRKEDIEIEKFDDGLSNEVFLLKLDGIGKYVLRLNGPGTELLINREKERCILTQLSAKHLCPTVFYSDEKCMLSEYARGKTLTPKNFCDPRVLELVALQFAKLHKEKLPTTEETWLATTLTDYVAQIEDNEKLCEESLFLLNEIKKFDVPIGLCHNDLRAHNVVYDGMDTVQFIDYEYADNNYVYFDIAHYFWQHDGALRAEDFVTANQDNREFFIRHYLHHFNSRLPSEDEIQIALKIVKLFEAANHYLWYIWAMLMGTNKTDFDYKRNAEARRINYEQCLRDYLQNSG